MKRVVKDKYIKELSKFGIVPGEEINISTRIKICKEFTNRIFTTFNRFPISQIQLFMRVYCLKIAYANIKGIRKAFYFYKNNTIYVDKDVLKDDSLKIYLYTEIIHAIQNFGNIESKNKRAGLVKFKDTKLYGIGLNEGAIQYVVSKMTNNKIMKYQILSYTIYSISETYRILTNLMQQIILIIGEEPILESLFLSNLTFERKFENIYENETTRIINSLDKIFSISTTHKHSNKELITIYLKVYKTIIEKYLGQTLHLITELSEIKTIRLLLEQLSEITPDGDTFFFEYKLVYNQELEKLYKKIEEEKKANALVEVKPNPISKLFKRINEAIVNIIME